MASAGLNIAAAAIGGYTDVLKSGTERHVSGFHVVTICTSILIGFTIYVFYHRSQQLSNGSG